MSVGKSLEKSRLKIPKSYILIGGGIREWDQLLQISASEFRRHDLNKRIRLNKRYGMVQCLETAEHIEPENAEMVVANLTDISDIVLFSVAIPYQRGAHHVNEQWPEYWIELFAKKDYAVLDCIREKVWDNPKVRGFYAQNIFLFCKKTEKNKKLLELGRYNRPGMYCLVHPAIWEELNNYDFMKFIDRLRDNKFFYWLYTTFIKKKYF